MWSFAEADENICGIWENLPFGLPFFHAFTGCDTVSAFCRKGKKSAWQTWEVFPDATDVFTRLSKRPHSLLETDMEIKEAFVCIMYNRGTDTFVVNKASVYQVLKTVVGKEKKKTAIGNQNGPLQQLSPTASCQELLKCGCKKSNCVGNCKCYRAGLSWSGLCTCNCQIDWTHENIMM
ncbi:uncharacterized protein LOC144618661 [Crassostrea virginica]